MLPLLIPILALMIPIVAILSSHQQKMAKLKYEIRSGGDASEIAALRAEVQELKEIVHQQVLAMDSMATVQRSLDLRERVGQ